MNSLCIIIPVFNEFENVEKIYREITSNKELNKLKYNVIFSDGGSQDGTIDAVQELMKRDSKVGLINPRVRTDLIDSVFKGMEVANSELTAVMDGDLQHRVSDLVAMINKFHLNNSIDLVVGVRRLDEEHVGLSTVRKKLSLFANKFLKYFFNIKITDILSGFFVLRTKSIKDELFKNRPEGFKVLFHILSTVTDLKIEEYPINFDKRNKGESKLNEKVMYDFAIQILAKALPINLPTQFLSFALIGMIGAIIHFFVFFTFLNSYGIYFYANLSALLVASSFNFLVNNYLTFSSNKLQGSLLLRGGIIYLIISLLTALSSTIYTNGLVNNGMIPVIATIISAIGDSALKFFIVRRFIWKT
jgi:dolichol-phosphate mannosyltransferase